MKTFWTTHMKKKTCWFRIRIDSATKLVVRSDQMDQVVRLGDLVDWVIVLWGRGPLLVLSINGLSGYFQAIPDSWNVADWVLNMSKTS